MTNDRERKSTCAVCGKTHLYRFPAFGNRFAGPDPHLDLRLPMIDRDGMERMAQECPECGYTAKYVSKPTQITRAYLDSEKYRSCGGMRFAEPLAGRFYRQYLILLHDRKYSEAVFALLHAAWLCDDDGETENAVVCRRAAADLLEREILPGERTDIYDLLYADLLRRSGQFEKLIDQFSEIRPELEEYRRLIAFEYVLAEKQDDGCYNLKDALQFRPDLELLPTEHDRTQQPPPPRRTRQDLLLVRTSRYLSLVLRHKPEIIGITLDEHGWADVDALLRGMPDHYSLTKERLEEIVRSDSKNRYAFNEDHSRIRANQGHSVDVDVELEELPPPEYLEEH